MLHVRVTFGENYLGLITRGTCLRIVKLNEVLRLVQPDAGCIKGEERNQQAGLPREVEEEFL